MGGSAGRIPVQEFWPLSEPRPLPRAPLAASRGEGSLSRPHLSSTVRRNHLTPLRKRECQPVAQLAKCLKTEKCAFYWEKFQNYIQVETTNDHFVLTPDSTTNILLILFYPVPTPFLFSTKFSLKQISRAFTLMCISK